MADVTYPTHPEVATVRTAGGPEEFASLFLSTPDGTGAAELLVEHDGDRLSLDLDAGAVRALRDRLDAVLGERRATIPF